MISHRKYDQALARHLMHTLGTSHEPDVCLFIYCSFYHCSQPTFFIQPLFMGAAIQKHTLALD
jgi:hypothetical protein